MASSLVTWMCAGVLATRLATAGGHAATLPIALPTDFDQRFMTACATRSIPGQRCGCILAVVKELIADEHLELMLRYFENEQLDERLLDEIERDEAKYNSLKQEMEGAIEAARRRCPNGGR